jgi:hypothetical protein
MTDRTLRIHRQEQDRQKLRNALVMVRGIGHEAVQIEPYRIHSATRGHRTRSERSLAIFA